MTSSEFVQWLKGFTEGVHEYAITPKQWDLLKERLAEVSDEPKTTFPFGTPNGTWIPNPAITTTVYIAPVGQEIPSFTITSGSSSTAVFPISGATINYTTSTTNRDGLVYTTNPASNVTYTTNGAPNWYSSNIIENDSREK